MRSLFLGKNPVLASLCSLHKAQNHLCFQFSPQCPPDVATTVLCKCSLHTVSLVCFRVPRKVGSTMPKLQTSSTRLK